MAMPKAKGEGKIIALPSTKQRGVMTGVANDIADKLAVTPLPPKVGCFLERVRRMTFGNTGFQERAGREDAGLSCAFDLAEWARILNMPKPNVLRVRARLEEMRIITFTPNPTHPGQGRIAWNLNLEEWQGTGWGGRREGAGNPYFSSPEYQALIINLKAKRSTSSGEVCYQDNNDSLSRLERSQAKKSIKMITHDSLEATGGAILPDALRKDPKEEILEETDALASDAASAAVSKSSSSRQAKTPKTSTTTKGKKKVATGEEKPAKKEDDLAWLAFHSTGLGLLEARYDTSSINYGKEGKALERLYRQNHASIEELCDFWEATLINPRWDTEVLSFAWIQTQIAAYRSNPSGYRIGMTRKREAENARQQRSSAHGSPTNARTDRAPAVAHHEPAANRSNLFNDD